MDVKTLFLVASVLVASTLSVAGVELLNPHDVLNKTRRDMNEFDQRMKGYKAEQHKKEKEAEAKRKQDEAERQKREQAEKALQEAQRKREAADQQKREKEAKAQQEGQKKRDAAAKPVKGAPPSSATPTPPQPSTEVSEPSSPTSQP
jgi:septal ring factor EnvC (AmiA/AmiB activator)